MVNKGAKFSQKSTMTQPTNGYHLISKIYLGETDRNTVYLSEWTFNIISFDQK